MLQFDSLCPPRILFTPETSSTMDDARHGLSQGLGHGWVFRTLRQNSGRGRMPGRRWDDDGATALLYTLILHRDSVTCTYPVTQLMALALCTWIEEKHGLSPQIKWPNDVMIHKRKIAGILVEGEGAYYLSGMGVNLQQRDFLPDYRHPAISLAEAGAQPGTPEEELEGILQILESYLEEPPSIDAINSRLHHKNQQIALVLGDPSKKNIVEGTVLDLQTDGALRMRLKGGEEQVIYSGEINR